MRTETRGALAAALLGIATLAGGTARGDEAPVAGAPAQPAEARRSGISFEVRTGRVLDTPESSTAITVAAGRQLTRYLALEISTGPVEDVAHGLAIWPTTVSIRASLPVFVEPYVALGAGLYAMNETHLSTEPTVAATIRTTLRAGVRAAAGLRVPATSSIFASVEASGFSVFDPTATRGTETLLQLGAGYRF